MGFLSKLFGGDSEASSTQAKSTQPRAPSNPSREDSSGSAAHAPSKAPAEPPKPGKLGDDLPTADVRGKKATRRAVVQRPANDLQPPPPVAPKPAAARPAAAVPRAARAAPLAAPPKPPPARAAEAREAAAAAKAPDSDEGSPRDDEVTRPDVAVGPVPQAQTIPPRGVHESVRPVPRQFGRPRPLRQRSPGFYSVSNSERPERVRTPRSLSRLPAVTGGEGSSDAAAEELGEVDSAAARAAVPEQLAGAAVAGSPQKRRPLKPPEPDFQDEEKTNPGLGNTLSRHDPERVKTLSVGELRLVAEFVVDLHLGAVSSAWSLKVDSALARVQSEARAFELATLVKLLQRVRVELRGKGHIRGEERKKLLRCIHALDGHWAPPVGIAEQVELRRRLISQQLSAGVVGLDPSVREQIEKNGLPLGDSEEFSAQALADRLGAQPESGDALKEALNAYEAHRLERGPSLALAGPREAVQAALGDLERAIEAFEVASDADDASARREARKQRQEKVDSLILLIAELGEGELYREITHCPVPAIVDCVRSWLTTLKSSP